MIYGKNAYILSLGGSLVVPNGGVDTNFLSQFNTFIRNQVSSKQRRFFITVGGGGTTRHYQQAASQVRGEELDDVDRDWLGIHATRLNAQMIRTIFRDIADPRVIKHYEIILKIDKPVAIAGGWKPGWSTDYCAVTLCQDYGIKSVINMTNIDHVYEKDPKKFPDAKPLTNISWKKYRQMIGDKWTPGMHAPFDPIASKLAQDLGITVKILNGKNLKNLGLALDNKSFIGTTIK
ncbi:aspartate kinase [Candidatus Gottesmanbacteria bacterium RIFCSPLOWO2_01_FULL_43_11b]|uniref:UMP kinase n=1 Tax=Candidatus Gottesmanbacteria bacterium RIFCSPLOWO2_01_FULL_43_11b TaxID=1798392 RepID=A0A1F6AGZ0_9BACT|nr:MAG: aspartate kinase [Candidatus Gottesmanbacteria bacterium RIFCSPLOWO2_01_FULL_43_11b]